MYAYLKLNYILLIVWIGLVLVLLTLPANMDEFLPYHVISCIHYPHAPLHNLREPCNEFYDLNLWGITLKRSYHYVGSLSSWIYYPLFLIIPHPFSHKLLGLLFFVAIIWITDQLEKSNLLLKLGLSFPILYQLIFDTGPVRFGLLVLFLSPLLVSYIMGSQQLIWQLLLQIALGLILFLALEDKPFFLYLLPSIICVILAYNSQNYKKTTISLILPLLVFTILSSIYLFASRIQDISYFEYIRNMSGVDRSWSRAVEVILINFQYLVNWYDYAHRNWSAMVFMHGLNFHLGITILEVGVFSWWKKTRKIDRIKVLWLGVGLTGNFIVFMYAQNVWAGHHFIFSYAILFLLLNHVLGASTARIQQFILWIISTYLFLIGLQFLFTQPAVVSSRERDYIFQYINQPNIAQNYIIVHNNWGTYYQSALYGDRQQLVMYAEPMGEYEVNRIMEVARQLNRGILCICLGEECTGEHLQAKFNRQANFKAVDLPTQHWQVWQTIDPITLVRVKQSSGS